MRKVALVFVLSVFVPSLVLAWLAVRSVRDQQLVLERQRSLLYQGVADALAKEAGGYLADREHDFGLLVEDMLAGRNTANLAASFDEQLRTNWPLAEVGFVVTLEGQIISPSSRPEAQAFCAEQSLFLGNRQSAEVYFNPKSSSPFLNIEPPQSQQFLGKGQRAVMPQQTDGGKTPAFNQTLADDPANLSKIAPAQTEFRQLIGEAGEGTLARFVNNKLSVLCWRRPPRTPGLVFGAQLSLPALTAGLRGLAPQYGDAFRDEISVAILDDKAKPVAVSIPGFRTDWKHPFVATEIGEALPHWEAAVYLLDPASLARSAQTIKLTLGLLIGVLVLAIGIGSWLIVSDLNRHLTMARQKTDFVSNVSHELKTPLTSIRTFSELLAEGRVTDPSRQRSYLGIIASEAARLTRLINNVLDFARIERGEKKYHFEECDLVAIVRETTEAYRPHLEANGFRFDCHLPETPLLIAGDRDALAQILVNLLSNAEKYSDSAKEITLQLLSHPHGPTCAEVQVLDRGPGVPAGCEEKIFEQFYRAHDSLSNGIQGSGLGLTLARQTARAHGGDVLYTPRQGGGSCFVVQIPLSSVQELRRPDPPDVVGPGQARPVDAVVP